MLDMQYQIWIIFQRTSLQKMFQITLFQIINSKLQISQESHKICQNCENDSSYIENLIQQLKLQWSCNSETGLKWVQYLNKLNFQIPTDNQQLQNITNELMKISKNIKDEEFLNQCSYQIKNILFDDPNFPFLEQTNYSYHELLYQVTNEEPIQQIKKDVTDIINFFVGAQYIVWKKQQAQDLQDKHRNGSLLVQFDNQLLNR
ncbi:hypothetical protein PPERSA_06854 [Pseudocohnilembus persalinus]|uniref:Uncharacterized protein n=1 Tax=Pseudocohnilembus persalinus TaxID=266149 RepID=A0A0V0QSL9_PSEPJ|nr:hypothetical protein PPERSA_06854 [Pseudocohnilembus persalinus]|eukprot:KRX05220.1 hypothetical protein PPERSA_06854 [Pseudocohnilembus persalinus]